MSGGDYLWDRAGDDAEVAALEARLAVFRHDAPLREPPPRGPRRGGRATWLGAAVIAMVAVAAVIVIVVRDPRAPGGACAKPSAGFRFEVAQGRSARCGGAAVAQGTLPVGSWLETPADTTAVVQIADIGRVTLGADSRLRLVATGAAEHRLELGRGRLSAHVAAPPRLFIVDTPAATAVDLGCAYELVVEDDGRTRLSVTSGAVSLEGHGRTAYVPVGVEVHTVLGRGPGTPVVHGADAALVAAIDAYDRSGAAGDLDAVLARAGAGDTITVWNLLANAAPVDRGRVMARLDELAPRPEWVLDRDVLAGTPQALEDWRASLSGAWFAPN